MRAQLLLDLGVEVLTRLAVDDAMDQRHRLAVQYRKLETIRIRDDAGDGPTAGRGHLDLALDQRLADFEIGIKLSAFKNLGLDLAAGCRLELAEIILQRHVS